MKLYLKNLLPSSFQGHHLMVNPSFISDRLSEEQDEFIQVRTRPHFVVHSGGQQNATSYPTGSATFQPRTVKPVELSEEGVSGLLEDVISDVFSSPDREGFDANFGLEIAKREQDFIDVLDQNAPELKDTLMPLKSFFTSLHRRPESKEEYNELVDYSFEVPLSVLEEDIHALRANFDDEIPYTRSGGEVVLSQMIYDMRSLHKNQPGQLETFKQQLDKLFQVFADFKQAPKATAQKAIKIAQEINKPLEQKAEQKFAQTFLEKSLQQGVNAAPFEITSWLLGLRKENFLEENFRKMIHDISEATDAELKETMAHNKNLSTESDPFFIRRATAKIAYFFLTYRQALEQKFGKNFRYHTNTLEILLIKAFKGVTDKSRDNPVEIAIQRYASAMSSIRQILLGNTITIDED